MTAEKPDERTSRRTSVSRDRRARRLWWLFGLLALLMAILLSHRDWVAKIPNALARQAMTRGDEKAAQRWLERAGWLSENNPESEFLRGRLARRQGRMEDAGDHLKRAKYLGLEPERIEREELLALAQSGQMAAAEPRLPELLNDPRGDDAEICEAYALGYARLRRFASALELIEAWQADFPDDPDPVFLAGQIYQDMHTLPEAERRYREALRRDPNHASASLALGNLLLDQKQPDEAIPLLRLAQQDERLAFDASLGLARCLRATGGLDESKALLEQLIAQRPDAPDATIERANLDIELGDYARAEERLRPLLDEYGYDRDLRFSYGTALRGMGEIDRAQEHFTYSAEAAKKVATANNLAADVVRDPDNAELRYEIGQLYLQYGSPEEGLIWLLSVLEIDPTHAATHAALAEYYQRRAAEDPGQAELARRHRSQADAANRLIQD